jgi:hypothetical protein
MTIPITGYQLTPKSLFLVVGIATESQLTTKSLFLVVVIATESSPQRLPAATRHPPTYPSVQHSVMHSINAELCMESLVNGKDVASRVYRQCVSHCSALRFRVVYLSQS